ncbi:glycosyltransferase family 4 protein [bacterium]|nr:glycosyltransferase family 4 protein [bacterium]
MKILAIDNTPAMGGSVQHLASLARELSPKGFEFRVIAANPELFAGIVPDGVDVRGLADPRFRDLFTHGGALANPVLPGPLNRPFSRFAYRSLSRALVPEVMRAFEEFAPDVVHINNLNIYNKVFFDALRHRAPIVLMARMIRLFSRAELAFAAGAGALVCVSDAVRRYLISLDPSIEKRAHVVPSGIPTRAFANASSDGVRAELGVPEDAPMALSLARVIAWKGHDVALRAIAELPGVWFVQAGGEVPADREAIDRLVAELGIADSVAFAGTRADAPRLLAACDVLVHSSRHARPEQGVVEAFGRVIAEALAAGKPVVATDAGGPADVIREAGIGRLVPPGDVDAMRDAIRESLTDDARREAGEKGPRAAARYDEAVTAARLAEIYESVRARRG